MGCMLLSYFPFLSHPFSCDQLSIVLQRFCVSELLVFVIAGIRACCPRNFHAGICSRQAFDTCGALEHFCSRYGTKAERPCTSS